MNSIFRRMVRALSFDERLYLEIAGDPTALAQAAMIVLLGAIAHVVGLEGNDPRCYLIFMVQRVAWWLLISFLVLLVGHKLFPPLPSDYGAGQSGPDFLKVARVLGFAMTPRLFLVGSLLPFVGTPLRWVIPFWWIGLMLMAVRGLFGYDQIARAAFVVAVGFIPLMLMEPFILSVGSQGTC